MQFSDIASSYFQQKGSDMLAPQLLLVDRSTHSQSQLLNVWTKRQYDTSQKGSLASPNPFPLLLSGHELKPQKPFSTDGFCCFRYYCTYVLVNTNVLTKWPNSHCPPTELFIAQLIGHPCDHGLLNVKITSLTWPEQGRTDHPKTTWDTVSRWCHCCVCVFGWFSESNH